ncbi:hypothetical protein STIUS_v1c06780 [Spiroplasma sp. TIUS-1]|uniref:hypothetical protein n=1 Tax=Spiroplasma sp. TIUS-1 TaxID=216963 RepID=UPI00139711A3|nr:hypothetical protein [Spiroplasma sp. TIUS-1]QHX36232.1 hypothetical protein STIUS_v1c06780 [Spiroplasma sp. TIUS-1]
MRKVNIRKIEQKDKKFIYEIFKMSEDKVEKASYQMLGLELLNEDDIFSRMVQSDARILELDEKKPFAIIESAPYESDALEIRMVVLKSNQDDEFVPKQATEKLIIEVLKQYGTKRVIMEISLKSDLIINSLIKSGFRAIFVINDTITLEFDYNHFNNFE